MISALIACFIAIYASVRPRRFQTGFLKRCEMPVSAARAVALSAVHSRALTKNTSDVNELSTILITTEGFFDAPTATHCSRRTSRRRWLRRDGQEAELAIAMEKRVEGNRFRSCDRLENPRVYRRDAHVARLDKLAAITHAKIVMVG
jgi:hypothetical protein